MPKRMENKIVLVSGAGSIGPGWGNGKACSVLYAREGAKVIACDINLDAAIETTEIIRKEGGNAIALQCDVSNQTSISKLFKEILKDHNRIDVLHSNVGIVDGSSIGLIMSIADSFYYLGNVCIYMVLI